MEGTDYREGENGNSTCPSLFAFMVLSQSELQDVRRQLKILEIMTVCFVLSSEVFDFIGNYFSKKNLMIQAYAVELSGEEFRWKMDL
jgi:hypothetical protein